MQNIENSTHNPWDARFWGALVSFFLVIAQRGCYYQGYADMADQIGWVILGFVGIVVPLYAIYLLGKIGKSYQGDTLDWIIQGALCGLILGFITNVTLLSFTFKH